MNDELTPTMTPAAEPALPDSGAVDAEMGAVWERLQSEGVQDDAPVTEKPAQTRGADGKFVAAQSPTSTESLEGEKGAAPADPVQSDAVAAPAHLPQALKSAWAQIPEAARAAIVESQTASDRKFSELGRQLESVRPIADRLGQAVEQFPEFKGMSSTDLAEGALQLAAIQARLERGTTQSRVETVLQIANQYGLLPDLQRMITGNPASVESGALASLQAKINSLESQLKAPDPASIDDHVSRAFEKREIEQVLQAFPEGKPFYAEVEQFLPSFIGIVKEKQPNLSLKDTLEAAYTMAVDAIPEVRTKRDALEASKATTANAQTKRAEDAKRAASINVKPAVAGKPRPLTEHEEMSAAYDRAMAS